MIKNNKRSPMQELRIRKHELMTECRDQEQAIKSSLNYLKADCLALVLKDLAFSLGLKLKKAKGISGFFDSSIWKILKPIVVDIGLLELRSLYFRKKK